MLSLLNEQFAPTTSSIGFVKAGLDEVADALVAWRRGIYPKVTAKRLNGALSSLLPRLQPLTQDNPRTLLVGTHKSQWTAYFGSSALGTDAFAPVSELAERLGTFGVTVAAIPNLPPRYGIVEFGLYGPREVEGTHSNAIRVVSAANDGGRWTFTSYGDVQPFENVEAYAARQIKKRFTSVMLADYCAALGVRPFDTDFYAPSGVLIESAKSNKLTKYTFAQAQERFGIRPGQAAAYVE